MNAPFNLFTRSTNPENTQTLPMLHSNNLFALGREIRIMHAGEEYRLRLTRNNRLILTK
ncbi:hemin uptake protein HemP [Acinetobacter boissieri]|uniref:Hemin uptake protein HemP n=1 Tax=Acinetobacter boissieri TaxID=1219383 RepID=A0A1G6GR52_9GAMM|nr:hemin uptake protein HemP [Acinetobacter boissieri]SDB84323.1 Hemin uptake protein HemP [Acinetobacter boissieri]